MSSDDDDDRTVFGQKLPPQGQAPRRAQPPRSSEEGERTVFGQPLPGGQGQRPPAQQPPPRHQNPYPPQQPYQPPPPSQHPPERGGPPPGAEDTWLGGRLTPQGGDRRGYPAAPPPPHPAPAPYPPQNPQGYQQQPPYQPAPPYGQPPAYPGYPPQDPQHGWQPPLDGQFPAAQQPATEEVVPVPRIAFGDALRGSGLDIGVSSNPILAAASDLLVLLGRLRTGMVEMQAIPLRDHVVREVSRVVEKCTEAGVPREDIELARYALAATADDIVQTIPGNDPQYWQQFSMAAELLNDRSAGIGFFARLEQVMGYPSQHADVLELMLVCLMLGFEGKYRSAVPNGPVQLSRLRLEAYRRFRSVSERPSEGLSHKWLPVILGGRRSGGAMPLWMVASVGAAMVVGLFATLSWLLSGDAQAAQNRILSLHQGYGEVSIERSGDTFVEYQAADTGQLERIREKLAPEIEAGSVAVTDAADAIAVRLGDALRFGSGSADLTNDLTALATRIGEVLEAEPGEIVIEGHSDNIPLRGTGRYKTNEALSEARANTVRDLLVPHMSDPGRLSVVGVGPAKPLNTDNTAAARAQNRRVEILLRKEERL